MNTNNHNNNDSYKNNDIHNDKIYVDENKSDDGGSK